VARTRCALEDSIIAAIQAEARNGVAPPPPFDSVVVSRRARNVDGSGAAVIGRLRGGTGRGLARRHRQPVGSSQLAAPRPTTIDPDASGPPR